jgi:hypothetical protein
MLTKSGISVVPRKKFPCFIEGSHSFPYLIILLFLHFFRLIYLAITKVVFQVCENNPLPMERMWLRLSFLVAHGHLAIS